MGRRGLSIQVGSSGDGASGQSRPCSEACCAKPCAVFVQHVDHRVQVSDLLSQNLGARIQTKLFSEGELREDAQARLVPPGLGAVSLAPDFSGAGGAVSPLVG